VLLAACGGARDDDPFAYDESATLDVRAAAATGDGDVRVTRLTYASPKGGRVPALLFTPPGRGPFAGVIVQHGLPSRKEDVQVDATELARLGAVVVAIDAPFARRPGEPVALTERDRDDQVQLIVDLRRAVDLLRSRDDVDDERIGYLGISYGGAMGGLLAGVESRVQAFVLMVGDGGLVEHFTGPEDADFGPLTAVSRERRERWLAAMRPVEPLAWVRKSTAPLLFLSGRNDESVPPRDARRYHRAAPASSEVRWYPSGHFLPPEAWCDAAHFLARHIGIAGDEHPAC
jgi:dienelactone hydrolase